MISGYRENAVGCIAGIWGHFGGKHSQGLAKSCAGVRGVSNYSPTTNLSGLDGLGQYRPIYYLVDRLLVVCR
jgi:hypothetical protein